MLDILFSFLLAFVITYLSLPIIIKIALQRDIVDVADDRKSHIGVVPSIGGVGIFAAFFLVVLFVQPSIYFDQFKYILVALAIIFAVGARDDLDPLSPLAKLIGQLLAISILIFYADIRISSLYGLWGIDYIGTGWSILLSTLVYVFMINSFNLIDGINGLLSCISIFIASMLGMWFLSTGHYEYAIMSFVLVGSVIAFLKYNITPAKIFMGDTGSLVIGAICTILVIQFLEFNQTLVVHPFKLEASPAIALCLVIIPVFDTLRVFFLRLIKKQSPFLPDKNHIHHLLIQVGLSHMQATSILLITNILFVIGAFQMIELNPIVTILLALSLASILSIILNSILLFKKRSIART